MDKIIFFTALIIFPFGQLIKIGWFNLFDILICLLAIVTIIKKPEYPNWYKYFLYFILAGLFSLAVNYKLTEIKSVLYLVRLFAYSYVAVYISNFCRKKNIIFYLLILSCASAVFGWLQYIFLPNTVFLKYFGWDDHLYRMIGTFLDPTYLALILLLGAVIAAFNKNNYAFYFLLFSLAFTYSRATYLALGLFLIYQKKYLAILIFVVTVLLLPKMTSEGTNFGRIVSGNNKLANYAETLNIIKKSPVIGIGFNNICFAKNNYDINSHSCFGSDSSILFILATTGVIGMILLLSAIRHMPYSIILKTSFLVVLIHSTFTNSLFYPHIMFWLFSLLGLGVERNTKRSRRFVT